ncbi:MAG: 16S rRNA (guanine(966)-N(2))-methyltransferase RsmD [Deltaproteobacteria bacterium]|nr:16S rRNA (guanine(966)-N(2))-methyltransferase RsmD [Deltaproteobacteria bacterium]
MRVVSGALKGKRLACPKGQSIRPTSDKVREAVFTILAHQGEGFGYKRVLDLFAGTGAMGIEAISRGAEEAVFVDSDPASCAVIRKNLDLCGVSGSAVLRGGALETIARLSQKGDRFGLVFIDPPYASGLASEALRALDSSGLLPEDGVCVAETSKRNPLQSELATLRLAEERRYGDTLVYIFRR